MSSERRKPYPFDQIEARWQRIWDERQIFHAPNPGDENFDPTKSKFYVLDMFPYPSGAGLHVGHPEGYTATDIIARYRRLRGFNVLHPMGWDAFGLPAEQYAIKSGQHPAVTTRENIAKFKSQLKAIGFSYDWQRELNTTDPKYFKWTQWIFLKIYNSYFDEDLKKARPISELREKMKSWRGYDQWPDAVHDKLINDRRLAYVDEVPVWWCEQLGTVLANEEVVEGKSEIGGFPAVKRPMRQWMLRITAYAERLIDELEKLEWPEGIKLLQRNWIGRSEGALVDFTYKYTAADGTLTTFHLNVFTTRPDTLYGAMYMVVAPEHPLISVLIDQDAPWPAETPNKWKGSELFGLTPETTAESILRYRAFVADKSDLEREISKRKTGVFTGAHAINPVNGERIPIWIADYVLMGYGTGAIMAVPAHDERDWEFVSVVVRDPRLLRVVVESKDQRFCNFQPLRLDASALNDLYAESRNVSERSAGDYLGSWFDFPTAEAARVFFQKHNIQFDVVPAPTVVDGIAINSPIIDGLPSREAIRKITDWLQDRGLGQPSINYKLRDWLFSRQRYWGEPFPIVWQSEPDGQYRKHCSLGENELPVVPPPLDDYKPTGTGEPPLAKAKDWVRYSEKAMRETNVMPQWAGSCWYYLRFCDPQNDQRFVGEDAEKYWMSGAKPGGVDLYVGGTEHAVLHLLYARFWHKVLFDLGYLSKSEPFQRLVNQGIILGEDGQKMSKSRGNIVNPDDVIEQYGADSFRCYEMFMGPLEQMKPWSMRGVEGVSRFLARVWRLMMNENQAGEWELSRSVRDIDLTREQQKILHATIKKVTADIESLGFNTAISQMMIFVNAFTNLEAIPISAMRTFLILLNPFAPHITSELWEKLKSSGDITAQLWPVYDEQFLIEDEIDLVIQVNGKFRAAIKMPISASEDEVKATALANPKIRQLLAGKTVRKVVFVPKKLVNLVVD